MKIAIMGYSGSGKTYLSKYLSNQYQIPALHLDSIKYDKAWNPIDDSIVLPEVTAFMKQDDWIIDGNYSNLLQEERLKAADLIIFVMLPRINCLLRVLKRTKSRRLDGYENDINPWFIHFVLLGCRSKARRSSYSEIISKYKHKTVVLKSQRQINCFINISNQSISTSGGNTNEF